MVERLFLAVPRGCLQFVIVVFPDHTHLLYLYIYCYFSNFGISPQFFVNILKFYHKVIPSKDADRNANSFNPDQTVSLYTSTVSTEKL